MERILYKIYRLAGLRGTEYEQPGKNILRKILCGLVVLAGFACKDEPATVKKVVDNSNDQYVTERQRADTLPEGWKVLDTRDSISQLYYKDVVGSDTLKCGVIIFYAIDDSNKYLLLRHGDTVHRLNKIPVTNTAWSLGVLEKEFGECIVTRLDNGNNVPSTWQFFDKQTGKNLLGGRQEAWGYALFSNELYCLLGNKNGDTEKDGTGRAENNDSIYLHNLTKGTEQGYKLPALGGNEYYYYALNKLTGSMLSISRRGQFSSKEDIIIFDRK